MLMPANDHAAFALFKSYIRDASGISEDEFNLIAHFLRPVHFNKGAVVLEIGSVCAHAFHVTRGLLRVATLDKNGDEHIVQFAPEGWFASDRSSMYFQEPSHLRIDAIEDTDAVMVGQDYFDALATLGCVQF